MTIKKPAAAGKLLSQAYHDNLQAALIQFDPEVHKLITKEYDRLAGTIQLLAAENQCSRAALAALGSILDLGEYKGMSERQVADKADAIVATIPDLAGTVYKFSLGSCALKRRDQ